MSLTEPKLSPGKLFSVDFVFYVSSPHSPCPQGSLCFLFKYKSKQLHHHSSVPFTAQQLQTQNLHILLL